MLVQMLTDLYIWEIHYFKFDKCKSLYWTRILQYGYTLIFVIAPY